MAAPQRPTLPSLKSLLLPTPLMLSDRQQYRRQIAPIAPFSPLFVSTSRPRQTSISSSITSASASPGPSRTPSLSPSPPDSPSSSSSSHYTLRTPPSSPSSIPQLPRPYSQITTQARESPSSVRLVPTCLSQADAILFVPPRMHQTDSLSSTSSTVTPISHLSRHSSNRHPRDPAKALLLVGPAMNHLRGPEGVRRQIALGARVHPYKIVPRYKNSADSRRGSMASLNSPTTPMAIRDVPAFGLRK